ncbi:DUF1049 domain-containing protein [Streptomyces sp. NPDC005573]|uniref:DUF1049 domain-containing protein n=1 Tax=unclassified Streptomyces TaxID=2593676 RepID=UPI0033A6AC4D
MSPKTPDSAAAEGAKGGLMKTARASVLALAALVMVFVSENTGATRIRILGSAVTMPLWTALLASGVLGALGGAYLVRRGSR